jgi:type IV pilus assembly protein PilV
MASSTHCKKHNRPSAQRGFSMIEVLVALLVMTIGLLGVAGLMLSGVSNATGFDLSSRATQSANEIMDAMRSNPAQAASYVTAYGTNPTSLSASTVAGADRKQWLESVQRLPGGDGKIEAVAGSPGQYQISIRFSNCLGTLSATETANCTTVSSNSDKRTISFLIKI